MDLWQIAPELDRWVDDHCIITVTDRIEAIQGGEAMWAEVVTKKLIEIAKELNAYKTALKEIAECKDVHTKLTQERLCCKFQDIAIKALNDD